MSLTKTGPDGPRKNHKPQGSPSPRFPTPWKVILTGGITFLACLGAYLYVDRDIAWAVRTLPPDMVRLFSKITVLGNSTAYLILSGIGSPLLYIASKSQKSRHRGAILQKAAAISLFFFVSIAVSGLLVDILKVTFSRYRPAALFKEGKYGFDFFRFAHFRWLYLSFPSGHSDTIFALATALSLVIRRFSAVYFLLALGVAISRVIVGAHFVSDVWAGGYLGIVTTLYVKGIFQAKGLDIFPARNTNRTLQESKR